MQGAGVPCGRVVSVKEIIENPHAKARGLFEDVWVGDKQDGWSVKMSRSAPVLHGYDTTTRWAGPDLGQHNKEVLVEELGLGEAEYEEYIRQGIVGV